ncbi:hypothetical protein ASG29_02290 [Sphingomonas sp. Leaf412]|uniref:hypothetical protein n=1 Tax=Sphingomonas sp. Leaf412 TaxID=1736370 RepID=UPI0006F75EDC|nr:hypothetical protein [Sphingomonas sp. Leaf412]KQT34988.1 hypothetical protein ASG29_02290 [Sphingomonas sp. Leaf412]
MNGTFDIVVDADRDLVVMRLAGFFDADTLGRFLAARAVAARQLRCGPNRHLSLTDISAISIQAQDMVAAFGAVLADPSFRSRRLAFVVATSLARVQLRRALGRRIDHDVAFFTDHAAAMRWLLTADARQVAA